MGRGHLKIFMGVALLAYCAGTLVFLVSHPDIFQWDFKTCYHAARAYSAGMNPYDVVVTAAVGEYSDSLGSFRFIYPLSMLFLFLPLSLLTYAAALHLFLLIKCVLLSCLIYLWGKEFLEDKPGLSFYLFCIVAFNSPLYIDLRAGNVAIVEQCALWLGFYFFLKRRLLLFCVCIFASAFFKVTPLLFLCMLWFSEGRNAHRYFWGSIAAAAGVALVSYLCDPVAMVHFVRNTGRVLDRRFVVHQPSTYDLLEDLLMAVGIDPFAAGFSIIHGAVFLSVVCAVFIVTWRASAVLKSLSIIGKDKIMIFLACTAYALILPHFEDYSYIIMVVPAYVILTGLNPQHARAATLILFMIISSVGTTLPLVRPLLRMVLAYSPLILAYLIWGLYVREIAIMARSARGQR